MGNLFSDVITSTSIGTGTTTTLLNGGTNYTVSSLAGNFEGFSPTYAETGAVTAGQTIAPYFSIQSQSLGSIQPKNIALSGSSGGVGTSIVNMIPIAKVFPMNTRIPNSNTPLSFYGTAYVANTVAPRAGATVWFGTDQPMRGSYEQFYDCVTATTSSGTAAATVTLNNIVVNGGTQLGKIYAHQYPGTVTVSESWIGYLNVNSADLSPQQTLRTFIQPTAAGLATTTPLQADAIWADQKITMRNTATLTASHTMEEAQTAAGQVAWGIQFIRGAYA